MENDQRAPDPSAEAKTYINRQPDPDPEFVRYAEHFVAGVETLPTYRPSVGCVIPCYNEAESIASVIDS